MYKYSFLLSCLMSLVGFAGQADTCSVTCSSSANLTLAEKLPPTTQNEYDDFKAYCQQMDSGAIVRSVYCGNASKLICVSLANDLKAWGIGSGANLYEARQNARKDCTTSLPPSATGCNVGDYYYRQGITYPGMECN